MAEVSEQDITLEKGECPFVVEITTLEGVPVFKGTVSQQGDFIHLNKHMRGSVATLRVHDMLSAAQVKDRETAIEEKVELLKPAELDDLTAKLWTSKPSEQV